MEEAINALKELLRASEPPEKSIDSSKGKKGRKKSDVEKILIMADKIFENLLLRIRKEKDES